MSSSNTAHHKTQDTTYSDKHKNVIGHPETKNETHNKTSTHEKQHSLDCSTVHSVKDSKHHVPAHTHTKNVHTGSNEHIHETTKHHGVPNTHGKTITRGHSDAHETSRKSNVHKHSVDKHETIEHDKTEHDKTDHPEIDHAVSISIKAIPQEVPPENPESNDTN